uniref:Cytochrome P450 n=1 Tax=Rhodonia placenta TaxID=104341 RepID=F2ZAF5_9APHY|nr:cytochrome P450 [Postia placenta]
MTAPLTLLILVSTIVLRVLYKRWSRISVADIPGPESESFWIGNLQQMRQQEVGTMDAKWGEAYGKIARVKVALGMDALWVSDPQALHYILQKSGYTFEKTAERKVLSKLLGDDGLDGPNPETHKRQRKLMDPAFGAPVIKALFPTFVQYAEILSFTWCKLVESSPGPACAINVASHLNVATIDTVCEASFDYYTGCLENADNELAKSYMNLAVVASRPSDARLVFDNLAEVLTEPVVTWLCRVFPGEAFAKLRRNKQEVHKVAENLIETKVGKVFSGTRKRDVMSMFAQASTSLDPSTRMSRYEVISQMRSIMFAGSETTTSTMSCALLELARHPEYQDRLRAEIRVVEKSIRARGGGGLTAAHADAMPYLQAFLKEVVRVHPAVPYMYRRPVRDEVLPLSTPITTRSGKVISEVPIRKTLRLILSVPGYNMDKDVWGEYAHEFNPERFLRPTEKNGPNVGLWANTLTFSAGARSCIGWKFALYEMQAFLFVLVSRFQFSLTEDISRLRREYAGSLVPMLEGEVEKGAQLPLGVSLAEQQQD